MNQLEYIGLVVVLGTLGTLAYEVWTWFRKRRKDRQEAKKEECHEQNNYPMFLQGYKPVKQEDYFTCRCGFKGNASGFEKHINEADFNDLHEVIMTPLGY